MILTCPSCGTRYVVKDDAIPEGGRTVRCAQCKHSWHQDRQAEAAEPDTVLPAGAGAEEEDRAPATEEARQSGREGALDHEMGEPSGNPLTGEHGDHAHPDQGYGGGEDPDAQPLPGPSHQPQASAYDEAAASAPVGEEAGTMPAEAAAAAEPYPEEVVPEEDVEEAREAQPRTSHPLRAARQEADDGYSPFADRDEEEEERPRRRWPLLLLLLLLGVAAIATAVWFLAPAEVKGRLGLAQASGETPLLLQVRQHSRQQLASGNQMLEISGLVINPTDEPQSVPPLQAQLRSLEQKVVHRWTIPPPAPQLAPGGSASFNSAELDIPAAAACLDVFFGTPREPQPPCRGATVTGGSGA
jgi:predicted Zn finger-like uncharacterized protein